MHPGIMPSTVGMMQPANASPRLPETARSCRGPGAVTVGLGGECPVRLDGRRLFGPSVVWVGGRDHGLWLDQQLVRAGFRMILEAQDDREVVGEAVRGTRRSPWSTPLRRAWRLAGAPGDPVGLHEPGIVVRMIGRLTAIVLDCREAAPLARFWAEALGWAVRAYDEAEVARLASLGYTPQTDPSVAVDAPDGSVTL
jgi:hypothetical protein